MGHSIVKENYSGKGWWTPIAAFMNKVGKCLNNTIGTGFVIVTKNDKGGLNVHCDGCGGGGGGFVNHPFKVRLDEAGLGFTIAIKPGGINNYATEMTDPPLSIVAQGYWSLVLKVTLDKDRVIAKAPELELLLYSAIPDDTETYGRIVLATMYIGTGKGGKLFISESAQIVTHSLWHLYCGDRHLWGAV